MRKLHTGFVVDTEVFSGIKGIWIGSEVDEFPIVLRFLVLNAVLDVLRGVLPACIFHPVRDDDAQDVFRAFGFRHLGEPMTDRINRGTDSIVEGCTAGAVILRHEVVMEVREVSGFDNAFHCVVELEEIEDGLTGFFSLFVQECVEGAFDVALDRAHGTGGIKDNDKVCIVAFHDFLLI